jgi:hypothetical protein
MRGEERRRR